MSEVERTRERGKAGERENVGMKRNGRERERERERQRGERDRERERRERKERERERETGKESRAFSKPLPFPSFFHSFYLSIYPPQPTSFFPLFLPSILSNTPI
jgi:hypothetical protein